MSETGTLSQRIRAEFDAREQRAKAGAEQKQQQAKEREERLAQFTRACDDLRSVWRPRIEEFARQFGDQVKMTPTLRPTQREVAVQFLTDLATVTLKLSASTDPDATRLVLDYDLQILPIFFEFERHSRLEMPLGGIDKDAVGRWIDDRLVSCVQAYLSMKDNEFYLKRASVQDPISGAKFLRHDAACMLEHNGQQFYFASEETLKQYKDKLQIK